jgi:hypothetical protein
MGLHGLLQGIALIFYLQDCEHTGGVDLPRGVWTTRVGGWVRIPIRPEQAVRKENLVEMTSYRLKSEHLKASSIIRKHTRTRSGEKRPSVHENESHLSVSGGLFTSSLKNVRREAFFLVTPNILWRVPEFQNSPSTYIKLL